MKTFKKFISELYQEENDSTFQNGKDVYNLNKIFKYSEHIKPKTFPVKSLSWILNPNFKATKRVKTSDLSIPILIWKYKGEWIVVDGVHRLEHEILIGGSDIKVKILNDDIMNKSRNDNYQPL